LNGLKETSEIVYQPDLWGAGIKTLAMLCIVIGILILVLFLVKRFLFLREGPWQGQLIRVLSSYHVTPKERIALIDVAGEKMVIGITPGNITCLAKIDKPEALAQIERVKPLGRGSGGFRKVLDIVSRRQGHIEQEIE
jgi:flagellar protein FliO/FliZ